MNKHAGISPMKRGRRPTLLEENKTLRSTIKALQDENANVFQNFHKLDKENAIMKEKLSNFGWRDLVKNAGWLGIGAAIGEGVNEQYKISMLIAIVSGILLMIFTVYDNFKQNKDKEKDKI